MSPQQTHQACIWSLCVLRPGRCLILSNVLGTILYQLFLLYCASSRVSSLDLSQSSRGCRWRMAKQRRFGECSQDRRSRRRSRDDESDISAKARSGNVKGPIARRGIGHTGKRITHEAGTRGEATRSPATQRQGEGGDEARGEEPRELRRGKRRRRRRRHKRQRASEAKPSSERRAKAKLPLQEKRRQQPSSSSAGAVRRPYGGARSTKNNSEMP